MGYSLHIERTSSDGGKRAKIKLKEWIAAVDSVSNVRLCAADHVMTNPKTGDVIRIPQRTGDAEVFYPDENEWHSVFLYSEGTITFRPPEIGETDPVWNAAVQLAKKLNAEIRGDNGEQYPLK